MCIQPMPSAPLASQTQRASLTPLGMQTFMKRSSLYVGFILVGSYFGEKVSHCLCLA